LGPAGGAGGVQRLRAPSSNSASDLRMVSTRSSATGEGLRCAGNTAENSKSMRGRKRRTTTPRVENSCAVKGSQIATPSPDDTMPHMISESVVSTLSTRRTSWRWKTWSTRWRLRARRQRDEGLALEVVRLQNFLFREAVTGGQYSH